MARYWQEHGITVIPTIRSSTDRRSLSWYLDGEPKGAIIIYSTMWGKSSVERIQEAFRIEWSKIVKTLKPVKTFVYGEILPIMLSAETEMFPIPQFTDKRWKI